MSSSWKLTGLSQEMKFLEIENSTFEAGIHTEHAHLLRTLDGFKCEHIVIKGSSFASGGHCIKIPQIEKVQNIYIDNSMFQNGFGSSAVSIGWEYGGVRGWSINQPDEIGELCAAEGRVFECIQKIAFSAADQEPYHGLRWKEYWHPYKGGKFIFKNSIVKTTGYGHGFFVGFGADHSVIINNQFSFSKTNNWGAVIKSSGNIIEYNVFKGSQPLSIYSGSNQYISNNTIVCTSGNAVNFGNQTGDSYTANNVFINNIVYVDGGGYCFANDNDPLARNHIMDYNCYFIKDGLGYFQLSGQSQTLDKAREWWMSHGGTSRENEENSISEKHPRLKNPHNGDFSLRTSSPCWNAGMPRPNMEKFGSGYSSLGAWQSLVVPQSVLEGDISMDDHVDLDDLAIIVEHWLQDMALYDGDLNDDHEVNLDDLLIFYSVWLQSGEGTEKCDFNNDQIIDLEDLSRFAQLWRNRY